MILACRLRELRQARGLSLRDAEAETGIDRGNLSRIERGMMLPPERWIPPLEQVYRAPSSTWYPSPPGAVAGVVILRELEPSGEG